VPKQVRNMSPKEAVREQLSHRFHWRNRKKIERQLREKFTIHYQKIGAWFYKRDITIRRIPQEEDLKGYGYVGFLVAIIIFVSFLLKFHLANISRFAVSIARACVSVLTNVAAAIGLSPPEDLAIFVIAEILTAVIVFSATGIMSMIFVREVRREKTATPSADIRILGQQAQQTEKGITCYTVKISNELGDDAAISCKARIVFRRIGRRDIVDVPNLKTLFNSKNFTSTMSFDLPWDNGKKTLTIRSGEEPPLEVLRLVPASRGVPAHFEVPSSNGTVGVCLNAVHYYGKVRITPLHGKFTEKRFTVTRDLRHQWFFAV